MRRLVLALSGAALLASSAPAEEAKKPKVKWLTKFADAQKAAQKDWKPIVIDAGREA